MKIKYLKYIVFLLPFITGVSCTKLDEKVYSSIAADNFFRNEQEVMLNVGRIYTQLRYSVELWGAGSMSLVTSGEAIVPFRETNLWWDNGTWIDLYRHNFSPSNPAIGGAWNFCFNGISTANQVLYQLETSPVEFDKKANILAEIKVIRAFYYFWALDWFGNIPITTDFTDTNIPEQSTRAEVFNFIEQELLDNVDALNPLPVGENYGRATKAMAYTLLAKLYLNAFEWTGVAKWDEAVAAADQVINANHFELEDDYFTNFLVSNEGSKENIFVIPFDKINSSSWPDMLIFHCLSLHSLSAQTFDFVAFTWDGFAATEELYNTYDPEDSRINSWLEGPQFSSSGEPLMLSPGRQLNYRPQIRSLYDPNNIALLDDGVRFKKYEYEKGLLDWQSMSNDLVVFRYADVLMIKAEALMRKSGSATAEVVDIVNRVRERAFGNSSHNYTTGSLTFDELFKELGREFAWENHRRQDVIRFGKWTDAWFEKPAGGEHTKLFPIPAQVLDVNPKLEQNTGY